jgi:hypothetical protein
VIIDPWPKPQHAHNDDQGAAECYLDHESAPFKETRSLEHRALKAADTLVRECASDITGLSFGVFKVIHSELKIGLVRLTFISTRSRRRLATVWPRESAVFS